MTLLMANYYNSTMSKEFNIPSGYVLKTHEDGIPKRKNWQLIRSLDGAATDVTNNRFVTIDDYFNNSISRAIGSLIQSQKHVKILDLAGGIHSEAVDDIALWYGDSVTAFNVDIATQPYEPLSFDNNSFAVQGDVERLPVADEAIDIVYSAQLLPYYRHRKDFEGELRILKEIKRVLRPGGVAILDEYYFSSLNPFQLQQKGEELGIQFSLEKRNTTLLRNIQIFIDNGFHKPNILVMRKPLSDREDSGSTPRSMSRT